ncbi:uncharacterized protein LOC132473851 [Gadus macrocephalus]|uniref:uncharacterized protein LOC132473851 n=1 Tax=Gadus macrocephalus TaxID=80720 RepID=UPI0028CB6754|nr:uncharacterized protein LOC132473851 [Gadus macrocephalus]
MLATCLAQGTSGSPTVRVMSRDTQALLDTGSVVTLLRPVLAGGKAGEPMEVACVHGGTRTYDTCHVVIRTPHGVFTAQAGIVPNLPVPLLIGRDCPIFRPNKVWHVDGYDKLKPFGIAISGCIDGYSRRLMWLSSDSTNNNPAVIARYYLQCVSNCGVVPARLRTDCGTENGDMAAIQCSLREDHTDEFAGPLSHMYGTSTANQRIESWWSIFRKQRTQFWMDLFSDLRDRHYFNGTHEHKCLVWYVLLGIFQKELDEHRELWNNHTIRPVRQSLCPSGKPETMYHLPHRFGGRDCGFQVDPQVLQEFKDLLPPTNSLCGDDNLQYFANLERQSQLAPPINWPAAVDNYLTLKEMAGL